MAQQYVLSTDGFTSITESSGIIQNNGIEAVELVSDTNKVADEGITLRPGERIAFDGAISVRRLGDNDAVINVVDFSLAGKGGVNHAYIPKGSVAFANLPTTLTEDMLGWTYNVSDAFTTDSQFVDGAGISYPAGQNVVVVEASEGVYKYDCFAGAYILPTASTTVKGGIKIGDSFNVTNDTLVLNVGSTTVLGGVKSSATDGDVTVNNDGTMTQNLIGYRKPNTAVALGDVVYASALSVCKKLVCIKAGTTGSGALTISSTAEGTLITDGTVTWMIDSLADGLYDAAHQNGIYRGADLTAYWDSGYMSTNVQAGIFAGIHPGDYIVKTVTVNGVTYDDVKFIVMDLDYFQPWSFGGNETHHLVMMPEGALGTQYMNSSNITTGGYVGSYMHKTHIPKVNTGIVAAFGSAHVLEHQEQLTNAVDTSKPSGAGSGYTGCATGWAATTGLKCCLCSENMVYGGRVWGSAMDTGCANKQLSAFRHNSQLRKTTSFWLRAVSYSTDFALANGGGFATGHSASYAHGVRPYFLLA